MKLATALSLSRAVAFGPAAMIFAYHHSWVTGFVMLALGCLSDALDGWAARQFHQESPEGKDWIDPLCDAAFGAWAMLGLALGSNLTTQVLEIGTLMVMLGVPLKALKQRRDQNVLSRVANIGLPLCEWTSFYVLGWLYLYQQYGQKMTAFWLAVSIPGVLFVAYIKRHRLQDWYAGRH
jgi:phosphatidylglycerophosphate synthase